MFEKIHFFSSEGNYGSKEVRENKDYEKFAAQHQVENTEDEDYHIDGRSCYLFPHPMPVERKDRLIHLQAFCYMTSGKEYYTKRSNFPSFLLLYTYQGSGRLIYDGTSYLLEENDLFLIDCRKPHIYRTEGEFWNHSDLHFFGGISEYLYQENFQEKEAVFHCNQPTDYQKQLEKALLLHTGSSIRRDFAFSCELEKLLLKILEYGENSQRSTGLPENIRLLAGYMEQHFQEDTSLEELARFAGMSKYYLCRQFKQYTGFTPLKYIIYLRLLRAEVLLQSTELPAYKIGLLTGFPSEANFIKHFKKKNGMTPEEFRR